MNRDYRFFPWLMSASWLMTLAIAALWLFGAIYWFILVSCAIICFIVGTVYFVISYRKGK